MVKKNLLLMLAIAITLLLIVSSARKILSFNSTARRVDDEEARLLKLREENDELKQELEYKKTQRFAEEEIRNKLGLAREGEEVFIVGREDDPQSKKDEVAKREIPNWKKWQILIFGKG